MAEKTADTVVITGAFSYTGKYATRLLLDRGHKVRTLTYHPDRENPFGESVQVFPYNFDHPGQLRESLRGALPNCPVFHDETHLGERRCA